ncbi:MAG TPA: WYL domain-containing protein, partial [Rhodanobacteraceae bacterium]|nr:WYL domain-containing protein [Rhodanobacteraceae bacterium]
ERGRHGAYMLVPGFKLPPMMFTDGEALALSIGLMAARNLGLHAGNAALASAQAKLERVLPESLKRRLRSVEATVHLEWASAPSASPDTATLMLLTHAAHAGERVHLHYRSAQGEESERDFDVYGLGFRGGAWYAVGFCHLRHGVRAFRLDRIVEAQPGAARFSRPAGFDVLAWLNRMIATLPRAHHVEVLLRTDLAGARNQFSPAIGLFETVGDGVLLRARTDDLAWFARQLARVSCDFEVRQPARLRKELALHARQLQQIATKSIRSTVASSVGKIRAPRHRTRSNAATSSRPRRKDLPRNRD